MVEELESVPALSDALAAFVHWPGVVLFESCLQRAAVGRYSFLTADPAETVIIDRVANGEDPFSSLREITRRFAAVSLPDLPPFQGGVAGVLAYECGHAWEQWPRAEFDEFQLPDLAVGVYDWVIAWDHEQNRAWMISHGYPETETAKRTERAAARLQWVRKTLRNRSTVATGEISPSPPLSQLAPQHSVIDQPELTSDFSREDYLRTVARVIAYIHAGDVFQVNLSQRLLFPQRKSSWQLYRDLRHENPAPFAGFVAFDDWAVVSASPERFLRVDGNAVETRPIKGTRQRRSGPEADLFTRDELRESEKDMAENVMIVDLLRNDLSRVCAPQSIRVPQLCGVESYETVQHLVSVIRGRLESPSDVWDLLSATFPGGSITGAPKVRAMQIISELEPTARGPYCGSLFYVGFDGQADSSILIRSFVCRHGWVQCRVGGGIVAQSNPVAEYEETLHKAEGMLRALR